MLELDRVKGGESGAMDVIRTLPEITLETQAFWTGGAAGRLRITTCDVCDLRIHPPQPICPRCLSRQVTARDASGAGTIYSFTVNHQPWLPGLATPYVIAIVDLDDQPGVRLTAEIVDCDPTEVAIGRKVEVGFERCEDVHIPFFRLA